MISRVCVIATAPLIALGPIKIAEYLPDSWDYALHFGYYPVLLVGLVIVILILYRVSLPEPLPTHRLILGAVLAAAVFVTATLGLRFYLTWITETGYTYGALATPIAFLLYAFFLGFSIMIGAELNAAIQEEWPAPDTHARRLRVWIEEKTDEVRNGNGGDPSSATAEHDEAAPSGDDKPPAVA